jgi:regulator of replication initiation timing
MKSDWTVCATLVILMGSLPCHVEAGEASAGKKAAAKAESPKDGGVEKDSGESGERRIKRLETEIRMLREEMSLLREELERVATESDALDAETKRLRMSMAASLAEGSKRAFDKESADLIDALLGISKSGDGFVTAAEEFCSFMEELLKKDKLSDVDKARAKFRLDKIRAAARSFHAMIATPGTAKRFDKCRVIAVDDKIQTVVLDVGYANGVRCGLLLWAGKDDAVRLKVVETRPFISAAVLVKGKLEDLAPGTEARIGKSKKEEK